MFPHFVCAGEHLNRVSTEMASRRARVKVAPKLVPGRRVAGQPQASISSSKNSLIASELVTLPPTQVEQLPVEEACSSSVAESESNDALNSGCRPASKEKESLSELSSSMNRVTEPPQRESNLETLTKDSTLVSSDVTSTKPPSSAPVRSSRLRGRVKAAPKLIPGRRQVLNGEAKDPTVQPTRSKSPNAQLQSSATVQSAPETEAKSNNSESGHEPHLGDMALVSLNQPDIPPVDSDWEDDQFTYNSVEVEPSKLTPELSSLITSASVSLGEDTAVSLVGSPICNGATMSVNEGENSAVVGEGTPAPPSASPMSPKLPRGLAKNRFKPNLFTDRRSRNSSGGSRPSLASPRARTISGSGTDSETEAPGSPARRTPVLERLLSQAKPARVRRGTECEMVKERSQFMRRKQEHKRRFLKGVPERGRMTMFDLIYYNPENGPRMSIEEEDKADSPEDVTEPAENSVDAEPDPPPLSSPPSPEPPGDGVPCPQVKLGANGEIILDDTSLVLETTDAKKAKDFLDNSPVAIIESGKTTATNYGTWSRKRKHVDWSEKETLRFYKALSIVGSDFSMMESIFKKRTRQELKLKFKKEERLNGKMVDKCLRERGMYTELEGVMEDSEQDSDVVEERGRKKIAKKRPRRRYRNKGYYDSSSGGEDADGEASLSPAKKRQREVATRPTSNRRAQNPAPVTPATQPAAPPTPAPKPAPQAAATQLATALGGVQFPPGLLAANPGLVGARPGSLVVVASPSKTDPGSQLLHVYMVSSRQKKDEGSTAGGSRERSRSPRVAHGSSPRSPSPRLTLDPAVVRAVDRSRLAEREGMNRVRQDRSRATSECEDALVNTRARLGVRQRTCSEGSGGDLRTELVRQRFLSGAGRYRNRPFVFIWFHFCTILLKSPTIYIQNIDLCSGLSLDRPPATVTQQSPA